MTIIKNGRLGFILFCSFFFLSNVYAQVHPDALNYYSDAMQFSRTTFGGSARYMGLAGASSALGGDIGTLYNNPAGLGLYNKSEFSISPGFNFSGNTTDFLGERSFDNRQSLNIANMGMVFSNSKDDAPEGSWRGGSFGISMTRNNNFQNQFNYSGINTKNSMTDYFAENTNGIYVDDLTYSEFPPDDIYSIQGAAYYAYLTEAYDHPNDNQYYSPTSGEPVRQEETVITKGNQYQWDIAYGANYDDRFYIGASVGIATIRHLSTKIYTEENLVDNPSLIDFRLEDNLRTRGTGINLKLGAIYRASDFVRFGLTMQTPTYYSMREEYGSSIEANYNNVDIDGYILTKESMDLVPGVFKYSLTTPARVKGGVAIFAGKRGFISSDIELVSYNSAKLNDRTDPTLMREDNITINNIYKSALNFNVGGEYRADVFMLRGGFAFLGDPYKKGINDDVRNTYNGTIGAGIRTANYYFDLAIIKTWSKGAYSPYTMLDGSGPTAINKYKNTNLVISAGTFF